MSIILPTSTLHGTVGSKLLIKRKNIETRFTPICNEIEENKQFWSIQPKLPPELSLDSETGVISGICNEKVNLEFIIKVSGSGKEYEKKFKISVLRPLPSDIVNLIKNLSTDGSSIGHGICEFIDNSIDADATEINIHMNHETFSNDPSRLQKPWVIIDDNGKGISKEGKISTSALEDALGLATSPDTDYCQTRLGAYGVGLPAAALTSALYCTIFTKKDGKQAIGHMSYDDIDTSGYLRFFEEEDIPSFLTEAESFQNALKLMKKKTHGTIVLLQDHYQVRSSIQEVGTEINYQKFKQQMNIVKTRLRDYLALVYHRFLQTGGIDLRKSDGEKVNRKITIKLGGKILPLDPLMEHCNSVKVGKLGAHIKEAPQNICTIQGKSMYYSVKMAILPGTPKYGGKGRFRPDGKDFDTAMSNALMVWRSEEAGSARPPPQELQGLYLYRNHRLIEFATWKGMFKQAPQAQVARVAIDTPLGLPIHNPKLDVLNDFSVDQRKRKMSMTSKINEEIKKILSVNRSWHVDDTRNHPVVTRAIKRAEYDKLGSKIISKTSSKIEKAIFEPSEIVKQFVPFCIELQDLTPITGKSPTRQWRLNNTEVGTGKKYVMEIEESGEYKLLLTVLSGNKKWQKSVIFEALDKKQIPKRPGKKNIKNEWKVLLTPKQPTDPPIELNGEVYELNQNNPSLGDVLKMMGLLRDE